MYCRSEAFWLPVSLISLLCTMLGSSETRVPAGKPPNNVTTPCARTASRLPSIASASPGVTTTTSAPSPSVRPFITSANESSRGSMTRSAPSLRAVSARVSSGSLITIVPAPSRRISSKCRIPIGPAPTIATLPPARNSHASTEFRTQANGSVRHARRKSKPAGTGSKCPRETIWAGASKYSARPPLIS